ncbi:hypothetical protein [Halomonas ventosae]|nr:hypothetical protein [Halomonas ventosae]
MAKAKRWCQYQHHLHAARHGGSPAIEIGDENRETLALLVRP